MTELALVTDHTEQALELLIDAYKDLPRMSGLVSSITNRLQEFEDINWDVINKRLLDYTDDDGNPAHAAGAQLDTIGRIVGRGRNGQDDATYLIYIRAQIFLNRSHALRGDIIELLQLIEPTAFVYSEAYPCTALIEFRSPPRTDPNILLELANRCVNGGVQLFLVAAFRGSPDDYFTLCDLTSTNDPDQGFGTVTSLLYGGALTSVYA